jgi:hypothetical protein
MLNLFARLLRLRYLWRLVRNPLTNWWLLAIEAVFWFMRRRRSPR